jgi:hypothetical protein
MMCKIARIKGHSRVGERAGLGLASGGLNFKPNWPQVLVSRHLFAMPFELFSVFSHRSIDWRALNRLRMAPGGKGVGGLLPLLCCLTVL